jgi:hypothetical protein
VVLSDGEEKVSEEFTMWRPTTGNADGSQVTHIPAGYKLYQLTVMADSVSFASFQIGNNPIIFVPANAVYSISGDDTPDYFDAPTQVIITLVVTPTAASQAQGVLIWGRPSSDRPLIRMAAQVCSFLDWAKRRAGQAGAVIR